MIRPAEEADIPALVRIENRSFRTDRLSPRSFRHMIAKANAAFRDVVGRMVVPDLESVAV